MHQHLWKDSSSFHPVHPLIRAFGPKVLHHAKGHCPGAGDAFMAGLLHKLLQYQVQGASAIQPEPMVRFASACGALVCQGASAIDPQSSADAVQDFLASQA